MPVEFLSREQKKQYGCFSDTPNDLQLARYFHLDEFDLSLTNKKRGKHNRLGFAIQLTSVRFLGAMIQDFNQVPMLVRHYIARQLDIPHLEVLDRYAKRQNTQWGHSREIKEEYGYTELHESANGFRLIRQLISSIRLWTL